MDEPVISNIGLTGALVTFSDQLSDAGNRRVQAFRAQVETAGLAGVTEAASTLASVYVGFDPLVTDYAEIAARLKSLLARAGAEAAPPAGRLWRIPAVFDGPQMPRVAEAAGLGLAAAIEVVAAQPLPVLMLGFAPGQPYLGQLPEAFSTPRQTALTHVPAGAIVTAIRQVTMFDRPSPTGWHWIGRMAFRMFDPEADPPIALRPGDQVQFCPVEDAALTAEATWTRL